MVIRDPKSPNPYLQVKELWCQSLEPSTLVKLNRIEP